MQNQSTIRLLNFFHSFIKLAKVLTMFVVVFTIISSIRTPNRINIPIQYGIRDTGTTKLNNTKAWVAGAGTVQYSLEENPPFNYMAGFNIFHKIFLAIGGFAVYFLLEKIVRSTLNKQPFIIENANRMMLIGLVFIATGILLSINNIIGLFYIHQNFSSEVITVQENFNSQLIQHIIQLFINKRALLGLFAILVAQILKYGIELKNENALTI